MKTLKTSQFYILFLPLVLVAFFVAQGRPRTRHRTWGLASLIRLSQWKVTSAM